MRYCINNAKAAHELQTNTFIICLTAAHNISNTFQTKPTSEKWFSTQTALTFKIHFAESFVCPRLRTCTCEWFFGKDWNCSAIHLLLNTSFVQNHVNPSIYVLIQQTRHIENILLWQFLWLQCMEYKSHFAFHYFSPMLPNQPHHCRKGGCSKKKIIQKQTDNLFGKSKFTIQYSLSIVSTLRWIDGICGQRNSYQATNQFPISVFYWRNQQKRRIKLKIHFYFKFHSKLKIHSPDLFSLFILKKKKIFKHFSIERINTTSA